jgi:hypothetical protein
MLCTLCFPINYNLIAMVHWHTVTQLWSCVPSAGSSQKTFISWWYTGTLSHNFYLVNTQLPYHLQFISRWYTVTQLWSCASSAGSDKVQLILWWYTGTLSHNSDLCTLCWLQSSSIYIAVVHWYTVTQLWSCAPSAGYNQVQFILRWYTGTLSHNSACV